MTQISHATRRDYKGTYYKYESKTYRGICQGCGRGYHGNRWDAHHVLPGTCFSSVPTEEPYGNECLQITKYDINAKYSMAGLPKLTAFILFYQQPDQKVEYEEARNLPSRCGVGAQSDSINRSCICPSYSREIFPCTTL